MICCGFPSSSRTKSDGVSPAGTFPFASRTTTGTSIAETSIRSLTCANSEVAKKRAKTGTTERGFNEPGDHNGRGQVGSGSDGSCLWHARQVNFRHFHFRPDPFHQSYTRAMASEPPERPSDELIARLYEAKHGLPAGQRSLSLPDKFRKLLELQ